MQLKVEKLIYGGDGLARLPADDRGPGKTVFIPFVLPGELVEGEFTEQKPGFARARLDRVIEPSSARMAAPCPYFQSCGGCHYQHASYEQQLEIKAAILRETLRRTAKIELECELQIHRSPEWGYRNRTRVKVDAKEEFRLGYYKFRSHELLAIEQCPISSPLINRAIAAAWAMGKAGEFPAAVRELEFFADHADGVLLMEAYCDPKTTRKDAQEITDRLAGLLPELAGATAFAVPMPNQFVEPIALATSGAAALTYQTAADSYQVTAGSFFQVNRFLIDELVKIVTADASGELALDLYAGAGLFSVSLARSFAQIIAVEASQTSYADLRHNAPREVRAVLATTEQYVEQATAIRPEVVVADPPRGGLGENVVRSLAKLSAPRITYVSCDPATLARDLRVFLGLGYKIAGAHLIDLFPQTFHLESVFHLAR